LRGRPYVELIHSSSEPRVTVSATARHFAKMAARAHRISIGTPRRWSFANCDGPV